MSAPDHSQGDEPQHGKPDIDEPDVDEPDVDDADLALIYNVVYCSRATAGVDEAQVQRIVATARRCNPEHGITGMLVFGSGIFFQWLEGPREHVTALMSLLRADPRHENVVELSQTEEVGERMFPDWDMEWVTGDHIHEVLIDARDSATDPRNARALSQLLAELESVR